MTVNLTDENFENEVLNYEGTYLVDMYADWCGPCKTMSPLIEALAEENLPNVKVGKLNIDDAEETATKYGIMSIPTFLIFKNGEISKTFVGITDIDEIRQALS